MARISFRHLTARRVAAAMAIAAVCLALGQPLLAAEGAGGIDNLQRVTPTCSVLGEERTLYPEFADEEQAIEAFKEEHADVLSAAANDGLPPLSPETAELYKLYAIEAELPAEIGAFFDILENGPQNDELRAECLRTQSSALES